MNPPDLSRHPAAKRVMKRPIALWVELASENGVCQTLEGTVPYAAGDALITGTMGEHWPVARAYFDQVYEAVPGTPHGKAGHYRKRPIPVYALELAESCTAPTRSGGELHGGPGDWLVQYAQGHYGIVRARIFTQTYEILESR